MSLNTVSVVATALAALLAGWLVFRVGWTAESINQKAGRIASTAGPINDATDAALHLDRTNELGRSIARTAQPLDAKLAEVEALAKSVDARARSIAATAVTVDETARGINTAAVAILGIGRSIDRGVAQINSNLDVTIGIAEAIKADAGNILSQARLAHKEAACIDSGLNGPSAADGHCQ